MKNFFLVLFAVAALSCVSLQAQVPVVAIPTTTNFAVLPDNFVAGGVRFQFTSDAKPKVLGSVLQANKISDGFYNYNSLDIVPVIVTANGKKVVTLQTVTQVGVAPVVYHNSKLAVLLLGQAGVAVRPNLSTSGGIAAAIAASTGAAVAFPLPGAFAQKYNLVSLTSIRYTFAGGTGLQANEISTFIGKGW